MQRSGIVVSAPPTERAPRYCRTVSFPDAQVMLSRPSGRTHRRLQRRLPRQKVSGYTVPSGGATLDRGEPLLASRSMSFSEPA